MLLDPMRKLDIVLKFLVPHSSYPFWITSWSLPALSYCLPRFVVGLNYGSTSAAICYIGLIFETMISGCCYATFWIRSSGFGQNCFCICNWKRYLHCKFMFLNNSTLLCEVRQSLFSNKSWVFVFIQGDNLEIIILNSEGIRREYMELRKDWFLSSVPLVYTFEIYEQ